MCIRDSDRVAHFAIGELLKSNPTPSTKEIGAVLSRIYHINEYKELNNEVIKYVVAVRNIMTTILNSRQFIVLGSEAAETKQSIDTMAPNLFKPKGNKKKTNDVFDKDSKGRIELSTLNGGAVGDELFTLNLKLVDSLLSDLEVRSYEVWKNSTAVQQETQQRSVKNMTGVRNVRK